MQGRVAEVWCPGGYGSGYLVSPGRVITALHVVAYGVPEPGRVQLIASPASTPCASRSVFVLMARMNGLSLMCFGPPLMQMPNTMWRSWTSVSGLLHAPPVRRTGAGSLPRPQRYPAISLDFRPLSSIPSRPALTLSGLQSI